MAKRENLQSLPPLNSEEVEALTSFARHHGRKWKQALRDIYWYNARLWTGPDGTNSRIGSILHGLRNSHGPSWLAEFKLP